MKANLAVAEIKVDPRFYKIVIGKKGDTIKKLNEEFDNCSIKVPGLEEDSDVIVVRGPKDDVEKLRKQIVQLVEETRHHEVSNISSFFFFFFPLIMFIFIFEN